MLGFGPHSLYSSVYFTISMQYASGPNYLSRFLSFINSTVRPRLTKLLPVSCKGSDDVILILMPVLHHTVMGAAPEDVQSLRAPRE